MSIIKTRVLFIATAAALLVSTVAAQADIFGNSESYATREKYMTKTPLYGDVAPAPYSVIHPPVVAPTPPPAPTVAPVYTPDNRELPQPVQHSEGNEHE